MAKSYYKKTKGTLYIVRANEYIKIGITTNSVRGRVRTLQVGCPFEIDIIFAHKTRDYLELEECLHNYFDDKRVRGEWFKIDDELKEDFNRICEEIIHTVYECECDDQLHKNV